MNSIQPEDVMRRLPNTLGLVREMRDLIEVILKRCAAHCMSGVALEEWDAINDQLVASHVKHKLEGIAAGFVYVKLRPPAIGEDPLRPAA